MKITKLACIKNKLYNTNEYIYIWLCLAMLNLRRVKILVKKWHYLIGLICVLGLVLTAGCSGNRQAASPSKAVELNVSAAVSLKDVLTKLQADYQAQHPDVKIAFNFGASGALEQQIEQGAPCDIFISAANKQMNELAEKGLVQEDSRKNLAQTELVLIVPKNSKLGLSRFEDLTKGEVTKIAIGETKTVPAGQYAREALKNMGLWDALAGKLVMANDVRSVLAYVETGNVQAGIVYRTDAMISNKVKIAATAPERSHKRIVYPAAVVKDSKQAQAARDFLAYLSQPKAQQVFREYGFSSAP
jgi:molybdate transport system substrate-binding protein